MSGAPGAPGRPVNPGLCGACRHRREITNRRGSVFLFCEKSKVDESFPRYPPLPVLRCRGFEREEGQTV